MMMATIATIQSTAHVPQNEQDVNASTSSQLPKQVGEDHHDSIIFVSTVCPLACEQPISYQSQFILKTIGNHGFFAFLIDLP